MPSTKIGQNIAWCWGGGPTGPGPRQSSDYQWTFDTLESIFRWSNQQVQAIDGDVSITRFDINENLVLGDLYWDGGNDGMYVEFNFIEHNTSDNLWTQGDAYVIVNNRKIDFGNFTFDNGTRFDSGLSNGIYWSRVSDVTDVTHATDVTVGTVQEHKVKLFLNSTVITAGQPFSLEIGTDAPDRFSIDDFVIQEDSRFTMLFNNAAVSNALPIIRSIDIPGLNETASGASFLNSAAVSLDALVSDMNAISSTFGGKSLDSLTDSNMRDMANALINGLESWYEPGSTSQGFEDWSEELWDSFAKQMGTTNSISSPLALVGSILGFASLFTPGGVALIPALASGISAGNQLFDSIKDQAATQPDLADLPDLTTIDLIGTLVTEMKTRGGTATRDLAVKLENTAVEAYKAYVDFATNTQLARHITAAINDQLNFVGIDYIRDLGYTVDYTYRPGAGTRPERWDIEITSGDVELGTSMISYEVTRNNSGQFAGQDLQIA
jgi:hypothetical protein